MGLDVLALLRRLGVSLDSGGSPLTGPGKISWIGRIHDLTPSQMDRGLTEGMEVWTAGQGFAPLDSPSIESWLFDVPRGDHLLIVERIMSFEIDEVIGREGRTLTIWNRENLSAFIGYGVLDGEIKLLEDSEVEEEITEERGLFNGEGPFALKPITDFSVVEEAGLDLGQGRPILLNGLIHVVQGKLKGPNQEHEIEGIVLNCGGLSKLHSVELLERAPMLNRVDIGTENELNFFDVLSERRSEESEEGMGGLLRWWRFDNDTATYETYNVLVPAHQGPEPGPGTWILNGVTNVLYRNQR
jgi:hypothetical protein